METRIVERGKGSGRADDHVEAAKVRIATYHQQSSGCVRACIHIYMHASNVFVFLIPPELGGTGIGNGPETSSRVARRFNVLSATVAVCGFKFSSVVVVDCV